MQDVRYDSDYVARFKPNRIVEDLLEFHMDLNQIRYRYEKGDYSKQDLRQFYQLIGWSVEGYLTLDILKEDEE